MGSSLSCLDAVREHPPYSWPKDHPQRQAAMAEKNRARRNRKFGTPLPTQSSNQQNDITPQSPDDQTNNRAQIERSKLEADSQHAQRIQDAKLAQQNAVAQRAQDDSRLAEEAAKEAEQQRIKLDEETRRIELEKERLRLEEETRKAEEQRLRAEEEARFAVEAAAIKAEEDALRAEEEAKRNAEEHARLKAEQDARLKAEQDASLKAEQDARLKAEEEAKKAEEEARLKAEEEEEEAKKLEQQRLQAEQEEHARQRQKEADEEAKKIEEEEKPKNLAEENSTRDLDPASMVQSTSEKSIPASSIDSRRAMFDNSEDTLPEARSPTRDVLDPVSNEYITLEEYRHRQRERARGVVKERVEKFEDLDDEMNKEMAEKAAFETARRDAQQTEWTFKHDSATSGTSMTNRLPGTSAAAASSTAADPLDVEGAIEVVDSADNLMSEEAAMPSESTSAANEDSTINVPQVPTDLPTQPDSMIASEATSVGVEAATVSSPDPAM